MDGILNLIESVSECFPSYSSIIPLFKLISNNLEIYINFTRTRNNSCRYFTSAFSHHTLALSSRLEDMSWDVSSNGTITKYSKIF